MDGGGSIGHSEVPSLEGGGGVTGFLFIFIVYINTSYFRSLLAIYDKQ